MSSGYKIVGQVSHNLETKIVYCPEKSESHIIIEHSEDAKWCETAETIREKIIEVLENPAVIVNGNRFGTLQIWSSEHKIVVVVDESKIIDGALQVTTAHPRSRPPKHQS